MPYRKAGSTNWYISYTDAAGKRVDCSARTPDYREAQALEHERRAEQYREKAKGKPQLLAKELRAVKENPTFEAIFEVHLARRPSERKDHAFKRLYPHFAGLAIHEIEAEEIFAYIEARREDGAADSTIAKELQSFSAAVNWCNAHLGWHLPNPCAGRIPRAGEGRLRWITHDEAQRLLEAVSRRAPHLRDYIRLALHSGMRDQEMLRLTWDRVDFDAGKIYLQPRHQKARRHSSIPLTPVSRAALESRRAHCDRWCPDAEWVFCRRSGERIASVKTAFNHAVEAAALSDFHRHDLRHTCASWLVQSGVQLVYVKELLRHKDIRTTMRYVHLAPDAAAEAALALEANYAL